MRVLFYHTAEEWSGAARAFAAAARALPPRGYQVTFVCRAGSEVERRLASDATAAEVIPVHMGAPWVNESLRLRQYLLDHYVEVVFVHTAQEQLAASLAVRLAERGAVVRRIGIGRHFGYGARERLADRLAATGFLLPAGEDPGRALPDGALEPATAEIGVDVEALELVKPWIKPPGSRLLVCVMDPSARRRVADVLRAMALLVPRHPRLRLALVGSGAAHDDLRMHAASLGITDLVLHANEVEDRTAILRAADLGWVVADHDTAGFALLDLQALRVPVVAMRTAIAQRYLADGIAGLLLPRHEPSVVAGRLAVLLAQDERRLAMGNAGRTRVARDFPERAMIDGFERAVTIARDRSQWRG